MPLVPGANETSSVEEEWSIKQWFMDMPQRLRSTALSGGVYVFRHYDSLLPHLEHRTTHIVILHQHFSFYIL
jgi:hypothetical protein